MGRDKLLLENGEKTESEGRLKLLKMTADVDEEKIKSKYDDEDEGGDDDDDGGGRWSDLDDSNGDSNSDSDLDASDSDDSDLDSDDEDEEAALQAELAKIRAERAAVKAREEEEAAKEEQAQMEEAALTGNPLLNSHNGSASAQLKRKWNDDVVFRNQARSEPGMKFGFNLPLFDHLCKQYCILTYVTSLLFHLQLYERETIRYKQKEIYQ